MAHIELHCHSNYSDGAFSPAELVQYAAQIGLDCLAITDHDSMDGYRSVAHLADQTGVELIPAIECTTRWDPALEQPDTPDIDVLGYFVDPTSPVMQQFERAAQANLAERVEAACQRLTAAGMAVTLADVQAENPRQAGYLALAGAVARKLGKDHWRDGARVSDAIVQRELYPCGTLITDAIATIRASGGVAVLAHPTESRWGGQLFTGKQLRLLMDAGLQGLEVFHPRLDDAARDYFGGLAARLGLLVTGGSDEHGWSGNRTLGSMPVTDEMLARLREAAGV